MNFDNWAWFNPSVPMEWYCNEATYVELAAMGVNTIRWYLNYALIEDNDNPLTYKQSGWDWLDQNLTWAEKYGIKIIINMHVPPSMATDDWDDSRIETLQLWVGENAASNMNRLKALWQAIATRYKDNPTVLGYGLLNEPRVPYINNSISDSEAQWETLAGQLKTLIRAIDTNHILFVEPTTKVYDTTNQEDIVTDYSAAMFTLDDSNYAMEVHIYDPLELTHQKVDGGYTPGAMVYPQDDVIALASNTWVDMTEYTGTNATPYNLSTGGFQTVESDKYTVSDDSTINIGYVLLDCSNAGSGSTIYWDNVKIAKYTNDGTLVGYVCEYDFSYAGNFPIAPTYWNNNVNWSSTGGVSNGGCLVVTGTTGQLHVSQNSDFKYVAIEKGYKYSAVATVKIVDSSATAILPHIAFAHTDSVHGLNKEYLREVINRYRPAANTAGVPLYIGEFGAFVDSFPYGGRRWTADMLDLCKEYGLSASFHEYKPGLYESYYSSVVDSDNVTVTEGTDVLDKQLYDIFKQRWKPVEMTNTSLIEPFQVPRIRSMSIGYFVWYTTDPTHPRMSKYITAEGFKELASLGFNSVRLYLNYKTYEDSYDSTTKVTTFKASGWEWLDLQIARAKAAGLRIVLSLHVAPEEFMEPGHYGPFREGQVPNNGPTDTRANRMQRTKNIWVAIASRYANEPAVEGFDLLNEPYLSGADSKAEGLDLYYGFIEELIEAIRKVNTYAYFVIQRPFAVNSTGYSMLESFRLVSDPKALYDFHWYYWVKYTQQLYNSSNPYRCSYPNSRVAAMISSTDSNFTGIVWGDADFVYNSSDWQDVESELIDWPVDSGTVYPSATWMMKISNLGSNGSVYIDDIYIKEYDSDGTFVQELMLPEGFEISTEDSLFYWTSSGATGSNLNISDDYNATASGSKSLALAIASGDYTIGNKSSWYYIPHGGAGHQYKVCCKMKFVNCDNTATVKMGLRSPRVNDAFRWTKEDCLRPILKRFVDWAKENHVGLYCGEFGCISQVIASAEGNGKEYLQDVLDLFDEYGINYSFHDYHSSTWGFYNDSVDEDEEDPYPTQRVANTFDVFKNYVE